MVCNTYNGLLPILPRLYEFPSGTFRGGDLSVTPGRGEEHSVRETICLYKDTMFEDVMGFGDPLFRAAAQQELKIAERVAAYYDSERERIGCIDEREKERRKWKVYHHNVRKYR